MSVNNLAINTPEFREIWNYLSQQIQRSQNKNLVHIRSALFSNNEKTLSQHFDINASFPIALPELTAQQNCDVLCAALLLEDYKLASLALRAHSKLDCLFKLVCVKDTEQEAIREAPLLELVLRKLTTEITKLLAAKTWWDFLEKKVHPKTKARSALALHNVLNEILQNENLTAITFFFGEKFQDVYAATLHAANEERKLFRSVIYRSTTDKHTANAWLSFLMQDYIEHGHNTPWDEIEHEQAQKKNKKIFYDALDYCVDWKLAKDIYHGAKLGNVSGYKVWALMWIRQLINSIMSIKKTFSQWRLQHLIFLSSLYLCYHFVPDKMSKNLISALLSQASIHALMTMSEMGVVHRLNSMITSILMRIMMIMRDKSPELTIKIYSHTTTLAFASVITLIIASSVCILYQSVSPQIGLYCIGICLLTKLNAKDLLKSVVKENWQIYKNSNIQAEHSEQHDQTIQAVIKQHGNKSTLSMNNLFASDKTDTKPLRSKI